MYGVPIRLEIGPRDVDRGQCVLVRRDTGRKFIVGWEELYTRTKEILGYIQRNMFETAENNMYQNTYESIDTYEEFSDILDTRGGFIFAG